MTELEPSGTLCIMTLWCVCVGQTVNRLCVTPCSCVNMLLLMYALRCTCIGLVISLLWVAYIYIVLVVIGDHSFGSVILGAIANSAEPFRGLVTPAMELINLHT